MASSIRIFLAHASEDKQQVRGLYFRLMREGFKSWFDEVDLLGGQNWQIEITKAIRESDIFLACMSRVSVAKQGYVQREYRLALSRYAEKPPGTIFLIPVKLDDCEIPDFGLPDPGVNFRDVQWVDLSTSSGFEQLLTAIRTRASQSKTTRSTQTRPEDLLRFVPARIISFPTIEFSLINTSHNPMQITSLLAIPCAKMKFETRLIREIVGPRTALSVDVRRARTGAPLRIAGKEGVFNLPSGEAEAFRLEVTCENTLNLICIEAEVVSRDFPTSPRIPLDHAVLVAAASDRYPGAVACVPKKSLVAALLRNDNDSVLLDLLPEVPHSLIIDLCLRAGAFLCDGDLHTWYDLRAQYQHDDNWGSIIASFAEYSRNYPCAGDITSYLDDWLTSPQQVKQIIIWDNEIRSTTVLVNRLAQIPKNLRTAYLLHILDSTATTADSTALYTFDSEKGICEHLKRMSLISLRDRAAQLLAELHGRDAVESLIAFFVTSTDSGAVSRTLEELTSAGLTKDKWQTPEDQAQDWVDWWREASTGFGSVLNLDKLAPILSRALEARMAQVEYGKFLTDQPIVRKNLALNPSIGATEIDTLAQDDDPDVRLTIARNKSLSLTAAEAIAKDQDILVRRHLASNRYIDISILKRMMTDQDEWVRKNAESSVKAVSANQ